MRLEGKVAIITGSGSGFGRATAMRFAAEGARVVVADLDGPAGEATVTLVSDEGGQAHLVVADIAMQAGARQMVDAAVARFGTVDVLVNNAGIAATEPRDTWDVAEERWDEVIRVNLKSVYLCSRAAIPVMLAAGRGSIVNVASIAASRAVGGAAYAATKGAILSYTRLVSRELAARGIRINCVSPGFMRTPMTTGERLGLDPQQQEERLEGFARHVPMRRMGTVDDIAQAILYLASDEAAYVTGQEIVIDGGYLVG
jgi:NAD(P)-dependent dehydrogenase (short-subunit alcohol dehydrogenase family)